MFPPPPDACATIQAQIERRAHLAQFRGWKDGQWLFCSEHGGMLLYDNVHRTFKASLKRAAVPAIRIHDLRVTFISLALRRGVKPEVVSKMVGHTSPLITLRIYRHIYADEMEDARSLVAGSGLGLGLLYLALRGPRAEPSGPAAWNDQVQSL